MQQPEITDQTEQRCEKCGHDRCSIAGICRYSACLCICVFPARAATKFKVGDRLHCVVATRPPLTVTEITERGFKYRFDYPWVLGTRLGSSIEGESYDDSQWELEPTAPPPTAEPPKRIWIGRDKGQTPPTDWLPFWHRTNINDELVEYTRSDVHAEAASHLNEALIDYMKEARLSHLNWAEHFERHPESEKQYAETREWDTAEVHRKWVAIYDDVIVRLGVHAEQGDYDYKAGWHHLLSERNDWIAWANAMLASVDPKLQYLPEGDPKRARLSAIIKVHAEQWQDAVDVVNDIENNNDLNDGGFFEAGFIAAKTRILDALIEKRDAPLQGKEG